MAEQQLPVVAHLLDQVRDGGRETKGHGGVAGGERGVAQDAGRVARDGTDGHHLARAQACRFPRGKPVLHGSRGGMRQQAPARLVEELGLGRAGRAQRLVYGREPGLPSGAKSGREVWTRRGQGLARGAEDAGARPGLRAHGLHEGQDLRIDLDAS